MKWNFSDVYTKVSEFLGLGSTPTGTNLTKVKDIVYRAYMSFLMPLNPTSGNIYVWSFLTKTASLTTKTGHNQVMLPLDFNDFVVDLTYAPTEKRELEEITLSQLRDKQAYFDSTSYPNVYAVLQGLYSPKTGQQKFVEFYPKPNSEWELRYAYSFIPEKPTEDADYFVGDTFASECILQMALAEAESDEDETVGVQQGKANQKLNALIARDKPAAPDSVGMIVDGAVLWTNVSLLREDDDRTIYGYRVDR